MKKVLEEVLEVEEKVNDEISQARAKAAEIRSVADKDYSEKVSSAKERGREIVQEEIENAKKEAQREGQERLVEAKASREVFLSSNTEKVVSVVEKICQVVLETET